MWSTKDTVSALIRDGTGRGPLHVKYFCFGCNGNIQFRSTQLFTANIRTVNTYCTSDCAEDFYCMHSDKISFKQTIIYCALDSVLTADYAGVKCLSRSPYGIGQTIIFLPCGFFFFFLLLTSFFSRLISAVGDWMSTILRHMVWS